MEASIILTNTVTLILSLIALLLTVFSYTVQNKTFAAVMQVGGFLCVLATVIYGLLLGASLTEILIFVLVFVLLGIISFLPRKEVQCSDIRIAEQPEVGAEKPVEETDEEGKQ